jgi:hypothetical protein
VKVTILFFCYTFLLQHITAQPPNYAGIGSSHTYTEQHGIDEENFYISGITSDGRVFIHSHTGSLFVIGNNYCKKIQIPISTQVPNHLGSVFEIGKNRFIAPHNTTYIIENNSITKWVTSPESEMSVFKKGDTIVGFVKNNLYVWKNDSFNLSYSSSTKSSCDRYFYADSLLNLWELKKDETRTDFYRINAFNKPEFQFSTSDSNYECKDEIEIKYPCSLFLYCINKVGFYNLSRILIDLSRFSGNNSTFLNRFFLSESGNNYSVMADRFDSSKTKYYIQHNAVIMHNDFYDSVTQSFYFGTLRKPFRYFQYLKKYPAILNGSASSIQALAQDSLGRIWAGSYDGGLAIIDKNNLVYQLQPEQKFLSGSFSTTKRVYMQSEKKDYRLAQYDMHGNKKGLTQFDVFFYYTFLSRNKKDVYFSSAIEAPVLRSSIESLESGKPDFKRIDSLNGVKLRSSTSITEDKKGRIWIGNSIRGFAVYDPKTNMAKTWLIAKNETFFGFWSSYTDDTGTVWLGTDKDGLMYFNDYSNDKIDITAIRKISHPLLPEGTRIMQLTQWGKWLIIGTRTDLLLLNLDEWYRNKSVLIRYLNPQEANLTAPPEQNTILTDSRDSSIWFATSDMLYQWDIKKWLSIPTFKVEPNLVLHSKAYDTTLIEGSIFKIAPTDNTLSFSIWFQSRDNMPRYMNVVLLNKGDSLILPAPSLQTHFNYPNLAQGNYELIIQICQSDGTVSIHRYPILIKKFWWQHWWVWLCFSVTLFVPIILMLISRNKERLATERAKRKDAELESLKAEQQKKLSALQIVSLSNQFRPHFILNALNTIGAELDNKPQAESVLSRLGESVDLIFNHAQQKKICHSIVDEWRLVKNVIDIHQMMYLKNLEAILPNEEFISQYKNVKVPLGLLQIPVENSLLHGLGNRDSDPWNLTITIGDAQNNLIATIVDNGVGRLKAQQLSNFSKHGTGTKNIDAILQILNNGKAEKITIIYEDGIFKNGNETYGTKVLIQIPKTFHYDI